MTTYRQLKRLHHAFPLGPPGKVLSVLVLAYVYFAVSKCGLLLAIPPGYATAVWPASGIAVAAVLIWGWRMLPGVWLGSTLTNLSIGLAGSAWNLAHILDQGALPFLIGVGAMLQAGAGAWLVRRTVGYPSGYDNAKEVLHLLGWAGPVACLCAATLGVTWLFAFGLVPSAELPFAWWTWWVGDTVGVLVFLPLTLLFFGKPRSAWAHRRWSVGVPLALSFAVSVALLVFANRGEERQLRSSFERDAEIVADQLRETLHRAGFAVTNTATFLANEPDFTHLQYLDLVQPILQSHPEILALEWVARVPAENLASFEARMDSYDFPGYRVRHQSGLPVSATQQTDAFFPVTYVAPLQSHIHTLGLNIADDPALMSVLADAAEAGRLSASTPIELTPPGGAQAESEGNAQAILLLAPVYSPNYLGQAQEAGRLGGVRGFSVAVLQMSDLFSTPMLERPMQQLRITLMDVTDAANPLLLAQFEQSRTTVAMEWSKVIQFAGRSWRFDIAPAAQFTVSNRSVVGWTVLASALGVSGLLGAFLLVVSGRLFRIESAVHERTKALNMEIAERSKAEERLRDSEARYRELAYHDSLTGLANREYFSRRLVRAVRDARAMRRIIAVHFFDLDHFKDINDALGHPVGDGLLRRIAQVLKTNLRRSDLLARLGGDEFAILQDGILDRKQAEELVTRTIFSLTMPFSIEGYEVRTSTSVGIAIFDGAVANAQSDEEVAVQLMEEADIALYDIKERARGDYVFHTPAMSERVHSSIAIGQALKSVLMGSSDELFMVYQPQVDIRSGRIVAFEALLRWKSASLGVLNPAEFVAIAEARGLIIELGRFTLRSACRMLAKIDRSLPEREPVNVAVNVSVTQFVDPGFIDELKAILEEEGIAAQRMELELTEAVLARSLDQVEKTMKALRDYGVKIAIDDFGTGYSSLLYLKRMPVHHIKVAQEFVRDMLVDPADAEIVRATIQIAKALGIGLVAEGVETLAHAQRLSQMGCEMAQGYYFSRPVHEADLCALWDEETKPGQSSALLA